VLRLGLVTLVVDNYDEAIAYYAGVLGFELKEDSDLGAGKRWVVVAPPNSQGQSGTALLLARAANDGQASRVGDQTGGRVAFFVETDDFEREYARLFQAGVRFTEQPRTETYGQVVVFEDLYGNRWDLIQLR
jgi:catechol 2,3-dioxygenase-like lactoylglutathione lyase family enzyme